HQNKFDVGMYKALQPLGDKMELVQSDRQGPDVLDFHISFYLGRLLQEHLTQQRAAAQGARFFVISKDRGFDSLIVHIRSLGFEAHRVATIRAALSTAATSSHPPVRPVAAKEGKAKKNSAAKKAPAAKAAAKTAVTVRVVAGRAPAAKAVESPKQIVIASLQRMGKKLPGKRKGLEHHIESHLGRKVGLDAVRTLIEDMEREGSLRIVENRVEYALPKAGK
ncbi:MAG: PIN domain-containing protein, partial [Burkholderiaceae bacterium]